MLGSLFIAKADPNGGVVLQGYTSSYFRLLGTSVEDISPVMLGENLHSMTFFPKEEKGVIAIEAHYDRNRSAVALIEIGRKDGQPRIFLDKAFVCDPQRVGQATEGGVRVRINRVVYSSSIRDRDSSDCRYVANGHLLCQFMAGKCEAYEVEAAAQERVARLTELEEAQNRVVQVQKELQDVYAEMEFRDKKYQDALALARSQTTGYKQILRNLVAALKGAWFLPKKVTDILAKMPSLE